jgi:transient receptor potential cation channel subfamily M protein 3
LELPKLLLTIQGGKANFELQPKLKKVRRDISLTILTAMPAFLCLKGDKKGVCLRL